MHTVTYRYLSYVRSKGSEELKLSVTIIIFVCAFIYHESLKMLVGHLKVHMDLVELRG